MKDAQKIAGIARDRNVIADIGAREPLHRKLAIPITAMTRGDGDLGDSAQSISSSEQEPGPLGSPQVPQGPTWLAALDSEDRPPPTANLDNC